MPVYVRKNFSYTPPYSEFAEEKPSDFLQDPDQFRDELPQPYRCIDRLLTNLVDNAWEIIHSRESNRIAEASKIRPPRYECASEVKEHGATLTSCTSPDSTTVFMGQKSGLAAMDAETLETIDTWREDGTDITQLHVTAMTPENNMCLLSTVDDMGIARLFAFAGRGLYLLQTLNEDPVHKMLAVKCEASMDSDFVGIFLETSNGQEGYLDVFKLPKDVWLKDLDNIVSKVEAAMAVNNEATPTLTSITMDTEVPPQEKDIEHDVKEPRTTSPSPKLSDPKLHKFAPATVQLRIKPPQPIQGVTYSSQQSLLKTIDQGDVIGTGSHHQISVNHLQLRHAVFKKNHEQLWRYMPPKDPNVAIQANFHFLTPGRILPSGMDNILEGGLGQATTVAIWWQNHTQFLQYSLLKSSKDLERKPDVVWPYSEPIICTAVTPCTSLIAIALKNGTLVIWDKHFGTLRRVLSLGVKESNPVQKMIFLHPGICPQAEQSFPPYHTQTDSYLLVQFKEGQLNLVNTALWSEETIKDVSAELENDGQNYTQLLPFKGIPELVLSCRENGSIYIHEILTGAVVCQICLPDPYTIPSPWEPAICMSHGGDLVFVKGQKDEREVGEDGEEKKMSTASLFGFHLTSFPALNRYKEHNYPDIPFVVHMTVGKRVEALMRHRILQQPQRKQRFQQRWNAMKNDLERVRQLHQEERTLKGLK